MTATRITNPYVQYLLNTGLPNANGTLTIYENGTTTLASIFSDAALTVPQTNPYTLNSLGQVAGDIFIDETVTILLKDDLGNTVWQLDDVNVEGDADSLINLLVPKGAAFFYSDVIAAGYTMTANDVVRGDTTGNTFRYASGTVVDPETDTPYDQDTGASNSGAWVDITIASAPVTESDITNLQNQIDNIEGQVDVDGWINGLITSNGTDADHDIDTAIGSCNDSTNAKRIDLSSAITKQIDVDWAEGTGQGGFPSLLTLAADTAYRFFLIMKDDNTVDAGFDSVANSNAAALLADASDYTYYRQIGWALTDAASNIYGYIQTDDLFLFTNVITDFSDYDVSTTEEALDVTIPPDTLGRFRFRFGRGSSAQDSVDRHIRLYATSDDDVAVDADSCTLNCKGGATYQWDSTAVMDLYVDENQQINGRQDSTPTNKGRLWANALGFTYSRGVNS